MGEFDLVNKLGAGCFASVFLAWQRSMQRWVALKLSAAGGDEPQTLAQLEHPFIVRVFDVRDIEDGRLRLLYMEYVRGGTLAGVIRGVKQISRCEWSGQRFLTLVDDMLQTRHEPPPQDSLNRQLLAQASWEETVCIIGSHLALALAYAQQQGVLHRDIKPANILLTDAAFPKLADFNVSFGSQLQGSTAAAHFGGSMSYMSPEQLEAVHPILRTRPDDLDATSDTYALGIVLWELLTGERPFPTLPTNLVFMQAVEQRASARRRGVPVEAIETLPTAAPPALKALLLRTLDPTPNRRFGNAADLARQLLLCLNSDVQRLLWRKRRGWLHCALRWPILCLLFCGLAPNVLFSLLNVAYNKYAAASDWAPPYLFETQVTLVNAVTYVVGVTALLPVAFPLARLISASRRGVRAPVAADNLIKRALRLGSFAAGMTLVMWTCCGIIFPVWTHLAVGEANVSNYGHFFLSQLICGALAGLLVFFLFTFLSLRAWIPAMLSPTDASSKAVELLGRVPRRVRVGTVIYALMPFLCLLLLPLGDMSLKFPYLALGMIGGGGFVWILGLGREILRDTSALRVALSPDLGRTSDQEKPGIFEAAQAVWASARS